jgi:hypothetical protein
VVALFGLHGFEAAEVVGPALHGDEAGAVGGDGGGDGFVALGFSVPSS